MKTMEKTWYEKLMSAYTEHTNAEFEEKGDNKITRALQNWENISQDALPVAWMLELEEILSWRDCIAPKFQDSYANILRSKALTSPDRLLVIILTGKTDEVIYISEKYDISLLSETTENVILKGMDDDKACANVLTVINNRPDTLTKFKDETFKKFHLHNDNATFLKNDKLYLLLNCFCESKDYKNFHNKIKRNDRFFWTFNNNEIILQSWDKLSDFELIGVTSFKSAMVIYSYASKNWQMDLGNFKKIIKLMDHENFFQFLEIVKQACGLKNFYGDTALIAKNNLTIRRLESGEINYKELYDQSFVADNNIPEIRQKIIQKYLES